MVSKTLIVFIIFLFISNSVTASSIKEDFENHYNYDDAELDDCFIYNLTADLSNIIFNVYDEKNGEIAKGRAFGTKGEHKAAEILYENMTKLGLKTSYESIQNTPDLPDVAKKLEVLEYQVKVNNKAIDCWPAAAWLGPVGNRNDLDYNFTGTNLKVRNRPSFPSIYDPSLANIGDFIFIDQDNWFNPNAPSINMPILNPLNYKPMLYISLQMQTRVWRLLYPNCKGLILYDFNNDTNDMVLLKNINALPVLFINGSNGKKILDDMDNASVDYYLKQRYNESVISYNVIGQLNGTDPSKTVIICSLYDSWWCQGTADSAIGMSIVLGIAKYFNETNITPRYNLKFIGFGGEEYGLAAGAQYYEAVHRDENIVYVIDLNQLGFYQKEPKLIFHIFSNKLLFLNEIWNIAKKTDYRAETGNIYGFQANWMPEGAPSNDRSFAQNRPNCKTICFLKDRGWILHHRDGVKHTEGDVLKYYDPVDVKITGKIILDIVKYLVC